MTSYGDLTEAGICTMGEHHREALSLAGLPVSTHEVEIPDEGRTIAFRCCARCAKAYEKLGATVREIGRGVA